MKKLTDSAVGAIIRQGWQGCLAGGRGPGQEAAEIRTASPHAAPQVRTWAISARVGRGRKILRELGEFATPESAQAELARHPHLWKPTVIEQVEYISQNDSRWPDAVRRCNLRRTKAGMEPWPETYGPPKS